MFLQDQKKTSTGVRNIPPHGQPKKSKVGVTQQVMAQVQAPQHLPLAPVCVAFSLCLVFVSASPKYSTTLSGATVPHHEQYWPLASGSNF